MNAQKKQTRTFTKRDLAQHLMKQSNISLSNATDLVDSVFTAIRETMMSAQPELRIEIRDFGVFEVKQTKSKPKARNPKSGEIIYVPARRKTHFKPGKILKKFLSQSLDNSQR